MTAELLMMSLHCKACRSEWCASESQVINCEAFRCAFCGAPDYEIEVTATW